MAIDFNGETLTITLESGVTEVDVREDLYEDWKDWLLSNTENLKYPRSFRPVGGDELSSVINAGAYFFLNNSDGWRIKPPEENITVLLTGNLALESVSTEAVIPTTGAFTTAILGIQPITQGVTPQMADQLGSIAFNSRVVLDMVLGYSGQGCIGSDEIGTRKAPSNQTTDGLAIARREGVRQFQLESSMTISSADDFSEGYVFIGDRPQLVLTLESAPDMSNCAMTNLTLTGEVDGVNTIRDCSIGNITGLSGFVEKVAFFADVTLSGPVAIFESYSQVVGDGYMVFDTGAFDFQVSDWVRSMGITNMTAGIHTIHMNGGQLHLDNLCTGGTIYLRGTYSKAPDDQSNGTLLIDETESRVVEEIHGQLERSVFIDTEQATNGNGYQQTPFNNITDGVDYAEANGLKRLVFSADATIDRQLKNFVIVGQGRPTLDLNNQIFDKSTFERCTLTGSMQGEIQATECAILNLTDIAGVFLTCSMAGTMTVQSGANLLISRVAPAIAAQPWTLSMNSGQASIAAIHNSSGGVVITDMDNAGDILHFNGVSGEIVFGATNTLGNAVCTGDVKVDDDLSGGSTIDKSRISSEIYLDSIT